MLDEDEDEYNEVSWVERVSPTFLCLPKVHYAYCYVDLDHSGNVSKAGSIFGKIKLAEPTRDPTDPKEMETSVKIGRQEHVAKAD